LELGKVSAPVEVVLRVADRSERGQCAEQAGVALDHRAQYEQAIARGRVRLCQRVEIPRLVLIHVHHLVHEDCVRVGGIVDAGVGDDRQASGVAGVERGDVVERVLRRVGGVVHRRHEADEGRGGVVLPQLLEQFGRGRVLPADDPRSQSRRCWTFSS
jgi:hypothetical protein